MRLRVEPLGNHQLEGFACGVDELDDWLIRHARTATGHGTRTYLLVDESGRVVGYFAVAPHYLARGEAPPRLGRGATSRIPAILLAKLALEQSLQGSGLGSELLLHALRTVVEAARTAGGRVVIVDAINDEASQFYERHDFQPLPQNPRRLAMKLSTAAKVLGLEWP